MKNFALLLVLLGLPACGTAADITLEFDAPAAPLVPTDGPPELVQAVEDAAADWADAGVQVPHIDSAVYVAPGSLNALCGYPDGAPLLACSQGATLLVREGMLTHAKFAQVIRHELGHSIRTLGGGSGGHLPCQAFPGDDLMCDGGSLTGEITERDVAFVTGALASTLDLKAGAL